MTEYEALVSLNLIEGIGSIGARKLLAFFGSAQEIFKASAGELMASAAASHETKGAIASFDRSVLDKELLCAGKQNVRIITHNDRNYPGSLKFIPDPPLVLYVKGTLVPEDQLSIAIVGSRRASFYGISSAEKFAGDLSEAGFTIVSGMARGIDTAAHRGALKKKKRTIAVMGSGFSCIYPAENKALAEQIAQSGAVISEFPMEMEPLAQNFPRRNRLVSGLTLGVVVIEAARNSGALITADCALEQGRDVFALPGNIGSATAWGTNALIQQGARLITCAGDILEELGIPAVTTSHADHLKEADSCGRYGVTASERVYDILKGIPVAFDELVERTELSIRFLLCR
jgi:DNA processing protein